ncbi:zinc finger a20 and an1 domain-containing stress-associated protein [Anaeramoeba ignava]|uniref:Zinc finger a20 and an1 domain-containing stress-associated protein n=1 Tax=Anaeramoeba ignava TaxID=1746090 RepID=A0A9Q0LRX2_ANAIG|nr:zinc finger a20 and an1 domain-containing stress-associated protein [Anaeramoeba ignava]
MEEPKLCKAGCGFYASINGLCSVCSRKISQGISLSKLQETNKILEETKETEITTTTTTKNNQNPKLEKKITQLAMKDHQFEAFKKHVIEMQEITPKKLQEEFEVLKPLLLSNQAHDLIKEFFIELEKRGEEQNYLFEHVIYSRVLDGYNLRADFGVEGYYHRAPDGKLPLFLNKATFYWNL